LSIYSQKGGNLEVLKCENCGARYEPPINTCLDCGGIDFDQTTISDTGEIEVWTTIYVPPLSHGEDAPYHIAVIRMDEGPKLTARVKADSEDMEAGKKVELVSDEKFKLFRII